jgi:hypothetical protein
MNRPENTPSEIVSVNGIYQSESPIVQDLQGPEDSDIWSLGECYSQRPVDYSCNSFARTE